jgi:hypothetical protein
MILFRICKAAVAIFPREAVHLSLKKFSGSAENAI